MKIDFHELHEPPEELEPERRPRPATLAASSSPASAEGNGHSPRARAALDGECGAVAATPEGGGPYGGRNNQLNVSAVKLGHYIASGELDETEIVERLTEAARASGLTDAEIGPTIRSGLNAGKQEGPRTPRRDGATLLPEDQKTPGSAENPGSSGSMERVLNEIRDWLARFIHTVGDGDLDLLALWAAHTHLVEQTYTTPRLLIDSPVPGSGKTTVLEHLGRLCVKPMLMATVSSPAMLTRALAQEMRTLLIDEADRALRPDKEGVGDLLAVLNSGYKRGATRPVLIPAKGGKWDLEEMPTFAPAALAGNGPDLPDDTRTRLIRVLLLPDVEGLAEESDWELIDEEERALGRKLSDWAESVREQVKAERPPLPAEIKGRARERWLPLKRVAVAAGGRWPGVVDDLAIQDVKRIDAEREDGIARKRPHVVLLEHIFEALSTYERNYFVATEDLIKQLIDSHPEMWGNCSGFGSELTSQRLGRMLTQGYNIHSRRQSGGERHRGYFTNQFHRAWRAFGLSMRPAEPGSPAEPT